jgi:hypothetical protein
MNRSYAQGFMDKCAELGVSPEALVKSAQLIPDEMLPPPTPSVTQPLTDQGIRSFSDLSGRDLLAALGEKYNPRDYRPTSPSGPLKLPAYGPDNPAPQYMKIPESAISIDSAERANTFKPLEPPIRNRATTPLLEALSDTAQPGPTSTPAAAGMDPRLKLGLGVAGGVAGAGALAYGVYKYLQAKKRKKQHTFGGIALQPA